MTVKVSFHVPNAAPALKIWPQWSSVLLCATLIHVIYYLQNTFVPIVYDTHILDHHVLQPLKEPVPTVTVLRKCNGQRKQLIVTINCHNCQDCCFLFACEKSASMQMTGRHTLKASRQSPNSKNDR
jgi:hypothetical protein